MIIKSGKLSLTPDDMVRALNHGLDSVLKDGFEVSTVQFNASAPYGRTFEVIFAGPVETRSVRK